MSILGRRIQARRMQLQLTQEQLGELIGKDQKQVWRYENGRVQPTAEALVKIAKALDTTPDYLLGVSEFVRPVDESMLDDLEREALTILRSQDEATRRRIVDVIRVMVN